MTLVPACPFLTPLPPPPPADTSALPSPAAIARAAVEESSLVVFVLQHLKAGLFAHIDAVAAPDNADSECTHPKPTSIAALRVEWQLLLSFGAAARVGVGSRAAGLLRPRLRSFSKLSPSTPGWIAGCGGTWPGASPTLPRLRCGECMRRQSTTQVGRGQLRA